MAIQVKGDVKNGIQLKYSDALTSSVTRTVNGANIGDKLENTASAVDAGGYTITAVYGFGQAIKTLVGAATMAVSLIQTRLIDDVS